MGKRKPESNLIKEHNINLVKNALMEMKTATRTQLAKKTGISQPTVNLIVLELVNKGIVRPGSFASSSGGRRPQCYTFKTNHLRAATIRVYRHSLEYTVFTLDGTVISRNSWSLKNGESTLQGIKSLLNSVVKQDVNIRVIGIGVPGVVGVGGILHAIPQIPDLEGVALAHELEEDQSIPIYVENDMNLVALGSVETATGQKFTDIVFMSIGEGIGAGIVIDGKIVRGYSRFAGEISFISDPYSENNKNETFESLLCNAGSINEQARLISRMVVSIICLINPHIISFGSTLATEELLTHLRRECEKHLPVWTLPSFQLTDDLSKAYDRGLMASIRGVLAEIDFAKVE